MKDERNWHPKYLHYLTIALVTSFLTTNILCIKIIGIAGLRFGATAAFFPFSLVIGDLLGEVYGFRRSRRAILIGLASYCYFTLISQIAVALPPAAEWGLQDAFAKIFGLMPRVVVAGCLAYLASELANAYVLTRLKVRQKGKHFWLRATIAAVVGELIHTGIGAPLVYYDMLSPMQLVQLVFTATSIKLTVQTLVLPLTSYLARRLKQAEGVDHFDKT